MVRTGLASDKVFYDWMAKNNERIGEILIPEIGEYPPTLENFYGSLMNEWVTTDLIRHYVDSIGDRNPLFRSQEYARKTRWGGIIGPSTFTDSIVQPYPYKQEPEEFKKFNGFWTLPNGARREIYKPIRPGDRLRAVRRYLGIKEVETVRPEPVREFDEVVQRQIINHKDEVVAIIYNHATQILNHQLSPENPLYPKRKRIRLTDEERDAIYHAYDNEKWRGGETRFWEDVAAGEELKLHPVGPYTVYDVAAFYTAMSGHAVGFELEWERIKLNFDFAWLDPEVNAWTCGGVCHFEDNRGPHSLLWANGYACGFYAQLEGLLGRMITSWMGDDGFVRVLDTRVPCYPMLGDVLHCEGRVTGKSTVNGEHLVDLDVVCKGHDGMPLVAGTARVQLPSRVDFKGLRY